MNSIAQIGIPTFGMRTEAGAAYAADGFARVTGEVTAICGYAGIATTVMTNGLAVAKGANSPILAMAEAGNGGGGGPEDGGRCYINQRAIAASLTKYQGTANGADIYKSGAAAFRALKTGVPAPVHLEFEGMGGGTGANKRFTSPSELEGWSDKAPDYDKSRPTPSSKELAQAVDMISRAERPVLIAGHGVFRTKAWDTLRALAEKHEMAVCDSGPMRGHFPMDHPLSGVTSADAIMGSDLVVFVGQYKMPEKGSYRVGPDAKAIQVDPEADALGKEWPAELQICSDEAKFLEGLAANLPAKKRPGWVAELAAARKKYQGELDESYAQALKYTQATGFIHPAVIGKELSDFLYRGSIDPKQTIIGFGGFTTLRYIPSRLQYNRPGQGLVGPYGFQSIGPDLTQMLGAAVASKMGVGPQAAYRGAPVVVQTTDAGMGYCLMEMDTAVKYKLPLIVVIYNNNAWGTWTFSTKGDRIFSDGNDLRGEHAHLFQEHLRYDLIAEGLGCRGEYVRTPEELRAALKRAYDHAAKESLPTVINVQSIKEYTSGLLYPARGHGYAGPGTTALT
jgi:thiamine pyrophosphate-dependent acetolactate synthase large subunit-like protein